MTTSELAAGLVLGGLGAAGHLAVVRLRVARMLRGAAAPPWPLGLAAPAAAILVAATIAPEAAWAMPVGLFAARAAILQARPRR